MPRGVYIRIKSHSQKQRQAARENIKRAHRLPRTQKQMKACCKNFIKARKIGPTLPRTPKQLAGKVFGSDIVEHHNDLCHGDERPDDITFMTSSQHTSLHNKLRRVIRLIAVIIHLQIIEKGK